MDKALDMSHLVAKFFSPCEPVKLKKNTIVIKALDHSYRYSH